MEISSCGFLDCGGGKRQCDIRVSERPQLCVQSLFAEFIEFNFPGEVGSYDLLHRLGDRRLECVPVDPIERVQLFCKNII